MQSMRNLRWDTLETKYNVQTKSAVRVSERWYLVADWDEMAMQILQPVAIGENEAGLLVVDATASDERWLCLDVDASGGLSIRSLHPSWGIDSVPRDTPLRVTPGTVLTLPNHDLYLGVQAQRGRPVHRLTISRSAPAKVLAMPNRSVEAAADDAEIPVSKTSSASASERVVVDDDIPTLTVVVPAPRVAPVEPVQPREASAETRSGTSAEVKKQTPAPPRPQAADNARVRAASPGPRLQHRLTGPNVVEEGRSDWHYYLFGAAVLVLLLALSSFLQRPDPEGFDATSATVARKSDGYSSLH